MQIYVILVLYVLVLSSACSDRHFGEENCVELTPGYEFHWSIQKETLLGCLFLSGSSAWVGIGISPSGGMTKADVMMFSSTNGTMAFTDRWSSTFEEPQLDTDLGGTTDVTTVKYSLQNGNTLACFSRKLVTGDRFDIPIKSGGNNYIWAYGSTLTFDYHETRRGSGCVDFLTGGLCGDVLDKIQLPPGFVVSAYIRDPPFKNFLPRTMAYDASTGDLYVGTMVGSVYRVSKTKEVTELAISLQMPNGVAFFNGSLFLSENYRIRRFDNAATLSHLTEDNGVVLITFAIQPTQHFWKYLRIGPDAKLYFSVNSPCNTCLLPDLGILYRMNFDGSMVQKLAVGIRDTQGFDFDWTGGLWFTDNGRDEWGNQRPPDELNFVPANSLLHFGFPYCYGTIDADPDYNPSLDCSNYTAPVLNLPPHTAALGMRFYKGTAFPKEYRSLYIAEHGSWNRTPPFGYRVTRVTFDPKTKTLDYQPFLTGLLRDTDVVWGRPVDVLELPDGSLLVSDDRNPIIYQIVSKT